MLGGRWQGRGGVRAEFGGRREMEKDVRASKRVWGGEKVEGRGES